MGSISNSLSTNSSPTTSKSSSSPSTTVQGSSFTGTSTYSKDFQNVIDRAVAIASLPISLLGNQQTALTSQSTELAAVDSLFSKLQDAIDDISKATDGSSFQTEYSIKDIVSATLGTGATEGIYTIHVATPGAYATSLSSATWDASAPPGGGTTTFKLVIGNQALEVKPADNSAQTVARTINSLYGNLVHATAVNVHPTGAADYRVSLQSATLGPMNIDLVKVPTGGSVTSLQAGAPVASYPNSLSKVAWDSAAGPFTLTIGGVSHAIVATDTSARGIAAAIQSQYGDEVTATVVNKGTSVDPDYRISLQSKVAGAAVDLQDALGVSLQEAGEPVTYPASQSGATWDETADPAGARTMYTLKIDSTTYAFAPVDNKAQSVADAINARFSSAVRASVVNLGDVDNPDYRIRLESKTPGAAQTLDILKTTAIAYQTVQDPPGALAQFEVDGGGTVESDTRSVQISEGITVTLKATGTTNVTVMRSTSNLGTALSSFADAYNAILDELGKQKGQGAGPLQGSSILSILSSTLSSIATYGSSTTGDIGVLEDLGLKLGTDGHLNYSPFTLMGADLRNSSGVTNFLGSRTGGGFLKAAAAALVRLQDPVTGLLTAAKSSVKNQITDINKRITERVDKVYALQAQLTSRMAAADALIASMQQQYSYFASMIQAQQQSSKMYNG